MYHTTPIAIVPQTGSHGALRAATALAESIGGSVVVEDEPERLRLYVTDERIYLLGPREMGLGGISVEFSNVHVQAGSGRLSRKQPLGRAIGPKARTVVDATAGMGQDAFLLACMGFEVLAIERSPIVAALVEDGLRRAEADSRLRDALCGRLRLVVGDARHVLLELQPAPDVVYVDPMFPPKRRASALPKKEIQLLRMVVGDDEDTGELLRVARTVAQQRVVLKRPTHAPTLELPSMSIEGKLVRYDVYVRH